MAPMKENMNVALGALPVHIVGGMILPCRAGSLRPSCTGPWDTERVDRTADPDLGSFTLISDDTVELSIAPGQFFHNGEEVTAQDSRTRSTTC